MATKANKAGERAAAETYQHCLPELPYRAVVFVRQNQALPLYQVAGSDVAAVGAENALRLAFKIHKGRCFYCKTPISDDQLTIDHVEPKAAGGSKQLHNLVIACTECNRKKGANPIEIYDEHAGREWLSALLAQVQNRLNRL
jgi:hypothetical protein